LETSVRKFPCPQCGADVVWHPGEEKLRCQYCAYLQEVPVAERQGQALVVEEQPLEQGLAKPQRVGWGTERKAYRCSKCGAVETLDPGLAAGACAFCGTPAVAEAAVDQDLVQPAGVLPFRIARPDAISRFRAWLGSLWFRPSDLKKLSSLEQIHGAYIPFWTFDADSVSHWTAEAGTRRGSGKNQRIDWRPASGVLEHRFDDLPVPASRGIDPALARDLEPFPTAELKPYEPSYLAGFVAEQYGVDLPTAWDAARGRMDSTLVAACRQEVPGDECRNLRVDTTYSAVAYKSGLLPIWIAAYRYRGKAFRYVVNGATGQASGTAPWSWIKISLAVGFVLSIVLVILWNS
jgi:DNA-directed RNA polymerase subunit RPC12/RpoP